MNLVLQTRTASANEVADATKGFLSRSALVAWIQHAVLLVLLAGFVVKGFVPAWRTVNSDFADYYVVARLYHAGYPLERVYDWTWLQRQKDRQSINQGLVSFSPSTLLSALPIVPFTPLPALAAKRGWLVANIIFLSLTILLCTRFTKLGWERVAIVALLAFIPLRNNFLLGQMHVLVLLVLAVAAWLYFRNSHLLSGVSLAFAGALKIYPALFLILLLWKRQWRAAIGLMAGLLSAAAMSFFVFGRDACVLYVEQVLPAGVRGEIADPYNVTWNSFTALLKHLLIYEPELNPSPVAHLPWLYAVLQPLIHLSILVAFMWVIGSRQSEADRKKLEWAGFLFLLLFLSSQASTYHLVALVLTAVLVIDYLLARHQTVLLGCVLLTYALISGPMFKVPAVPPVGWRTVFFFSRLALMTVFGGLLIWNLLPRGSEPFRENFNRTSLAVASLVLVGLTTVGFISTQHHLRGQFDNYAHRVMTIPNNLFASDPALSDDGILFVKMIPKGYTIDRLEGGVPLNFPSEAGDLFHPTSAGGLVWAEEASGEGSRVVRLRSANVAPAAPFTVEAENAQEPSASRDGHALAFLRNVNGRNSLWVKEVAMTPGQITASTENEIAGEEYDVREATWLDSGRLIFSSRWKGKFVLYTATLQGKVERLSKPSCSARYPAVAPDGRWLAFSCDEGGSWQLHAMDLEGTQESQLTNADCNSIAPAWFADSKRIIYATDCGRGLGLTALAEVTVLH